MKNSKGEEVICDYDLQECHKCDIINNCMVGIMSQRVVEVKRVPELEKKLNEMVKEIN